MNQRSICQCVDVVLVEYFHETIGECPMHNDPILASRLVTSACGEEHVGPMKLSTEAVGKFAAPCALQPYLLIGVVFDPRRVQ